MAEEIEIPTVFISYSHDTPEHKRWVSEFAARLIQNGINVLLDQWELRPGDDVPKFMERSIRSSDRVLVICTEAYVRKTDEGVGGVGYESMVVTGELIRDLGTAKFIPIIRQTSPKPSLPAALSTRFFINLSDETTYESEFDRLLRELHKVPPPDKPPLGKNPFATTPSGAEVPPRTSAPATVAAPAAAPAPASSTSSVGAAAPTNTRTAPSTAAPAIAGLSPSMAPPAPLTFSGPEDAYRAARAAALGGDMAEWRAVVRGARQFAEPLLAEWWKEFGGKTSRDAGALVEETRKGAAALAPLIAVALAAVGSGREKFSNQVALLEEILNPSEWSRSGYDIRVELPEAAGFLYQALHGAVCLTTDQLPVAIRLVRARVRIPGYSEPLLVGSAHSLMGWPQAFGQRSTEAWKALLRLPEHWPWLDAVFGDRREYADALTAYYMALNVNEYAIALRENQEAAFANPADMRLDTPTHFAAQPDDTSRRAYRLLTQDVKAVREIWASLGVSDKKAAEHWPAWLAVCGYWHHTMYPFSRGFSASLEGLMTDVASP